MGTKYARIETDRHAGTDVVTSTQMEAGTRRPSVVLAANVDLQRAAVASFDTRPLEDYETLEHVFDVTHVDPPTAVRGRIARFVSRTLGDAWVVAFQAVRRGRRADAIVALADDVGVPMAAVRFLLRVRTPLVIVCVHLRARKTQLLLRTLGLHRQVQRFMPYSVTLRDVLIDEVGVPAGRVDTLYNTVDERFFSPDGTYERQPPYIASAGLTLRDYKTLLDATRGLDVDVKIEALSIWYRNQAVNFTEDDVHDRVELCDDGTTTGLRDIYAGSTMVVVPLRERGEPAGNTSVLEGMAMAKPVIVSDLAMGGDFIRDGETGFLVPPEDVESLRLAIIAVLEDADLRRRVGRAGRQAVEAEFTREHFARAMETSVSCAIRESRRC
jgi:glycosyltransferase involved in cell wall biosynthesis